jgi:hypothetical protein
MFLLASDREYSSAWPTVTCEQHLNHFVSLLSYSVPRIRFLRLDLLLPLSLSRLIIRAYLRGVPSRMRGFTAIGSLTGQITISTRCHSRPQLTASTFPYLLTRLLRHCTVPLRCILFPLARPSCQTLCRVMQIWIYQRRAILRREPAVRIRPTGCVSPEE